MIVCCHSAGGGGGGVRDCGRGAERFRMQGDWVPIGALGLAVSEFRRF